LQSGLKNSRAYRLTAEATEVAFHTAEQSVVTYPGTDRQAAMKTVANAVCALQIHQCQGLVCGTGF
jgi:hypothetical protein